MRLSLLLVSGDTTGYVRGVSAASPAVVHIPLALGGILRGRLSGGSIQHVYGHAQRGQMRVEAKVTPEGFLEARGLCDVAWTLVAEDRDAGLRAEAQGRPGETVLLPLTKTSR